MKRHWKTLLFCGLLAAASAHAEDLSVVLDTEDVPHEQQWYLGDGLNIQKLQLQGKCFKDPYPNGFSAGNGPVLQDKFKFEYYLGSDETAIDSQRTTSANFAARTKFGKLSATFNDYKRSARSKQDVTLVVFARQELRLKPESLELTEEWKRDLAVKNLSKTTVDKFLSLCGTHVVTGMYWGRWVKITFELSNATEDELSDLQVGAEAKGKFGVVKISSQAKLRQTFSKFSKDGRLKVSVESRGPFKELASGIRKLVDAAVKEKPDDVPNALNDLIENLVIGDRPQYPGDASLPVEKQATILRYDIEPVQNLLAGKNIDLKLKNKTPWDAMMERRFQNLVELSLLAEYEKFEIDQLQRGQGPLQEVKANPANQSSIDKVLNRKGALEAYAEKLEKARNDCLTAATTTACNAPVFFTSGVLDLYPKKADLRAVVIHPGGICRDPELFNVFRGGILPGEIKRVCFPQLQTTPRYILAVEIANPDDVIEVRLQYLSRNPQNPGFFDYQDQNKSSLYVPSRMKMVFAFAPDLGTEKEWYKDPNTLAGFLKASKVKASDLAWFDVGQGQKGFAALAASYLCNPPVYATDTYVLITSTLDQKYRLPLVRVQNTNPNMCEANERKFFF